MTSRAAPTIPTYTKQFHRDVYPAIDATRPELSAKGKRVVITGGGSGIGAATAKAFAAADATEVFILGRTQSSLNSTRSSVAMEHANTTITPITTDLNDPEAVTDAFNYIATSGSIDIFVNNAGYFSDASAVAGASATEWTQAFNTNVLGSLYAVQAVLKNISPSGVIINVSTGNAHAPYVPGQVGYGITKLASAKMFEAVGYENPGLRVHNLQPAISNITPMGKKAAEQTKTEWGVYDSLALPGNFMVWLASPEGAFLKGRFVWANWDVNELKEKKKELEANPLMLTLGLLGWPN